MKYVIIIAALLMGAFFSPVAADAISEDEFNGYKFYLDNDEEKKFLICQNRLLVEVTANMRKQMDALKEDVKILEDRLKEVPSNPENKPAEIFDRELHQLYIVASAEKKEDTDAKTR